MIKLKSRSLTWLARCHASFGFCRVAFSSSSSSSSTSRSKAVNATSQKKVTSSSSMYVRNSLNGGSMDPFFLSPSLPLSSGEVCDVNVDVSDAAVLSWYSCGPTVYDKSHLGHARTYVCTDVIRRTLVQLFSMNVDYALGITDIDDKIINKSLTNGLTKWSDMLTLSRYYEAEFFRDMDALNVLRPNVVLRVSEHVEEIKKYIAKIEKEGFAYCTEDGVYFDVNKFGVDKYGKLGISVSEEAGEGGNSIIEPDSSSNNSCNSNSSSNSNSIVGKKFKRSSKDFALWKSSKPGEPSFDSPWGLGRPGWHIECSAMTHAYFGERLDVHSGGVDLKFPHHTNEIAQCEAHNRSDQWVRYWLHTGHLYIDGLKMSKSLKNFVSIRDFLNDKTISSNPAADFRIFCLQYKYNSSLHFTHDRIREASAIRVKFEGFFSKLNNAVRSHETSNSFESEPWLKESSSSSSTSSTSSSTTTMSSISSKSSDHFSSSRKPTRASKDLTSRLFQCKNEVKSAMGDDFNTPKALQSLILLQTDAAKYLQGLQNNQPSSPDNEFPIEALLETGNYMAWVLETLFGVADISSNFQYPAYKGRLRGLGEGLGERQATSSLLSDHHTASSDLIIDSLVEFRSKVRRINLETIKALKNASKRDENTTNLPNSTAAAAAPAASLTNTKSPLEQLLKENSKNIMTSCDDLRDIMVKKYNIAIEDDKNISTWTRK